MRRHQLQNRQACDLTDLDKAYPKMQKSDKDSSARPLVRRRLAKRDTCESEILELLNMSFMQENAGREEEQKRLQRERKDECASREEERRIRDK